MQTFVSYNQAMLKKAAKILSVIVAMWIVSLFTIVKEYKGNKTVPYGDKELMYEHALDRFRKRYDNGSTEFRVWQALPFANTAMSEIEKDNVVKGYEYPPGAQGRPVHLYDNLRYYIRQEIQKGWRDHAFNKFVSDLIPVNRTLKDVRDSWCKRQNYSVDLPKITVIICFYDEAWSTLIRTVMSVLNRSPKHLIDQIILVDDKSTMVHLKKRLEEFVRSLGKVMLIRTGRREGIVRARLLPLKYVKTPVIVYLDSHCECNEGWLEPLLQCIKDNPKAVVSPIIDHIHATTFEYVEQDINDLRLGGFNWDLQFSWIPIPAEVLQKRKHMAAPIKTPTIAGGIYAIHMDFFKAIGFYDEEFELWGGDNLELSFKTWMCGGTLLIVPCSHVGHIFRQRFPYEHTRKTLTRNMVRLAEVWMDDYAKYFYERIGHDKGDFGNLTSRFEIRKKRHCKPFKWYLDTIYPQIEMPDQYVASGQIYSAGNNGLCLDGFLSLDEFQDSVKILPCHFEGGNQFWVYTSVGEIKRDSLCLDFVYNTIILFICRNSASQVWLYNQKTQLIRHMETEQCLNIGQFPEGMKLVLTKCSLSISQKWIMEHFKFEKLAPQMQLGIADFEHKTKI